MSSSDDEDDPVVRTYDVFITPEMSEQLFVLQYPNRAADSPYCEANHAKPLELRMKPRSGHVELDVPMNIRANYDKIKGIEWGEAVRKVHAERSGGSFGFAGGFGSGGGGGGAQAGRRGAGAKNNSNGSGAGAGVGAGAGDEISQEAILANFEDASNKGHVLNKQTLGGQIVPVEDGDPIYMIGAFRGDQLHLTPTSHILQMRPQFHHLDATVEHERSLTRSQRDAANPPRTTEARLVQMTVKSSDGDDIDMGETSRLLRAALEESWQKMTYYDEDSPDSWTTYHDKLFLHSADDAPLLESNMSNDAYLDAISAPRVDPAHPDRVPRFSKLEEDDDNDDDDDDDDDGEKEMEAEEKGEGEAGHADDDGAHAAGIRRTGAGDDGGAAFADSEDVQMVD
ncbi:MAG: hypothetical protein M1819_001262 [Sarea resinae]|nr:MAG: hypothetical protein M1819_001262 [Sarea resinae]